ncbi:MAG: molybdenum cofactor biosysynthesis protein [Verrucomicrobiales bacterium]|nr:molybdenum cofactor biosysynthesis protein [Verrucomicrobiales bacterium]
MGTRTTETGPRLVHLFLSSGHNFFGHHGEPAGRHPIREVRKVHCIAGRGLEGDRFFDFKRDYKGQITFFALETHRDLVRRLGLRGRACSVYRRNVITRGVDLNALIGTEFELQGIRFEGTGECTPCEWMDEAFGPGAHAALEGRGGLRARILTSGILRVGPADLPQRPAVEIKKRPAKGRRPPRR